MGGSSPAPVGATENLELPDYLKNTLPNETQNYIAGTKNYMQMLPMLTGNYQTNFNQYAPQLQTDFKGPQFSNQLDSFSQNVVSQGAQGAQQKLAAQQAQTGAQFRNNRALAGVLQSQQAATSQLGQNPMYFQAAAAQRAREGQEFQLSQQSQALTNAARLAQSQGGADMQGLQNAALAQKAQLTGAPLQAQQNLLAVLTAISSLTGNHTITPQNGTSSAGYSPNNNPYAPNGTIGPGTWR